MNHLFDFTYRGHEVTIMQQPNGKYTVDVREDDFEGEWIGGYMGYNSVSDASKKGVDCVEQYIHDQTHFTEGISI